MPGHAAMNAQNIRTPISPIYIVRYYFTQLSDLEQCSVNELAQGPTQQVRV